MRDALLARQRGFVRCVADLNKSHIGEVRLDRLNRFANFRKQLLQLIEQMVEARAQELAAGMLQELALERQPPPDANPFPLPQAAAKRGMPKWVREESQALRGRPSMRTNSSR